MATQNVEITQWTAKDIVYALPTVQSTDLLIWGDRDQNLFKRSDAYGGNGEIIIEPGVGATVKLTAEDTAKSPAGITEYSFSRSNTPAALLFEGVLTTTEGTPPEGSEEIPTTSNYKTPREISSSLPIIDMLEGNNWYITLIDNLTVEIRNFENGEILTVVISNPNNITTALAFTILDKTIKWPGDVQPSHPEGVTLIYSFQRIGDYLYAAVSDSY